MALDLFPYMRDNMYVGFTSATGTRAELHTIYSWWFLAGFGKLSLPVSPPSSHRPLASLGQRSIVIAIFSLAVMVGFLGFFCIYVWRRWQKRSKHLIDILLPVACWMYWKESITCEVRSARCLQLAMPTLELLAWLWRTRLAKKHDRPQVKTWPEMLLKRKMGPGEAWQLEDKRRRKRRKPRVAVHVMIYEEAIEESPGDEDDTPGRVKVIKHISMRPVPKRKAEDAAAVERKSEPCVMVLPPPPVKQQRDAKLEGKDRPPLKTEGLARSILKAGAKGKDKDPKRYIIGSDSFVVVEEESDAQLFQRRGSFLVPQGAPDDGHELPLEPAKELHATVPVVAAPRARRSRPEAAGPSKVKIAKGRSLLQPETLLISTGDPTSDAQLFQRRGSFLITQDARDDGLELPLEPAKEVHASIPVVAALQARPQPEAAGPSKVKIGEGPMRLQPETLFISTDDPPSDKFYMRRGSFSVHPEDGINIAGARSAAEGGKESSSQYLVEQGIDGDIKFERGVDVRRGSFSVHPEAAVKLTGRPSAEGGKEPSTQYLVEQDITSTSKRRIDVRRGSFIIVEDAGSLSKPRANDQAKEIVHNPSHDHSGAAEGASNQFPKSPPTSVSSADDGGKSHVTHVWLFE